LRCKISAKIVEKEAARSVELKMSVVAGLRGPLACASLPEIT